jgi:hypothetical protein
MGANAATRPYLDLPEHWDSWGKYAKGFSLLLRCKVARMLRLH